jgi:hypothetical protein
VELLKKRNSGDESMNVYEKCPVVENETYLIRLIQQEDEQDLFAVYHDKLVLPFLNSDNCHGSNFYCSKLEDVHNMIHYWLLEYHEYKGFVRLSIVDKMLKQVIGTIEIFNRTANDYFTDCGLLRLDVRRDFEIKTKLSDILKMIQQPIFEWFNCKRIATKAPVYMVERLEALTQEGFVKSEESLIGADQKKYYDYWIIEK